MARPTPDLLAPGFWLLTPLLVLTFASLREIFRALIAARPRCVLLRLFHLLAASTKATASPIPLPCNGSRRKVSRHASKVDRGGGFEPSSI